MDFALHVDLIFYENPESLLSNGERMAEVLLTITKKKSNSKLQLAGQHDTKSMKSSETNIMFYCRWEILGHNQELHVSQGLFYPAMNSRCEPCEDAKTE